MISCEMERHCVRNCCHCLCSMIMWKMFKHDIMHSNILKMWMFCSINWLSHITSHVTVKVIAGCSFA